MKKINKFHSRAKKIVKKLGLEYKLVSKNLLILLSLLLLSTLAIMLFSIFILQSMLSSSYSAKSLKIEKFNYWMEKVDKYPNAPDVLYNAAVVSVGVNKKETALNLLKKALIYDPLFTEARKLQNEIVGNSR